MAFNAFDPEDEKKKQEEEGGSATGETVMGGAGHGGLVGGGTSAPSSTASGAPTRSNSWVNLTDYLDANAGRNFGEQAAGRVQAEVDQGKQAQGQADTGFRQAVDASRVKYDEPLANGAMNNPRAYLNDADKSKAFTRQRDATYTGPNTISDSADLYQPAKKETDEATDFGNLSKTESGRTALLGKLYDRPSYNQGEKALDNLILQNDPNSRTAFGKVQKNADALQNDWTALTTALDGYASGAKKETDETRVKTQEMGTNAIGAVEKTVDDRVAQMAAQKASELASLQQAMKDRTLTDELAQKYGLKRGQEIYNVDPASYVRDLLSPDRMNLGTDDEKLRLSALNQLMGRENTFFPSGVSSNGAYDQNKAVDFNLEQFMDAINQSKNALDTDLASTKIAETSYGLGSGQGITGSLPLMDKIATLEKALASRPPTPTGPVRGKLGGANANWKAMEEELGKLRSQRDAIYKAHGVGNKLG